MGDPQGAEAIIPVPLQGQLAFNTPWVDAHQILVHRLRGYNNNELDLFVYLSVFKRKVKRFLVCFLFIHVPYKEIGSFS